MPRGRPPRRDEIAAGELEFYDRVTARAGDPARTEFSTTAEPGYYSRMLASPEMAYHLSEMGRLVRAAGLRPGSYSHAERELVDQVLCKHRKTNLVLEWHIPDALAAGVRLEAIEALRSGHDEALTEDERQIAEYVRRVADLKVTDEAWNGIERRLGERGALELTIFIALLNMILTMQSALGMREPSDEEIDQIIRDFREGKRAVAEFVDRSG